MIWFFVSLSVVLAILLMISLVYLLKLANTIFRIEDNIENSLDVLDRSYNKIGKALEIPVGSDDPVVRAVVDDIKNAHDAILIVANDLSTGWQNAKEEKND